MISIGCRPQDSGSQGSGSQSTEGSGSSATLETVEIPDLSALPSPAPQQIAEKKAALDELIKKRDSAALAMAFGELGELLHAYQLAAPALVCYRNAASLESTNSRWPYLRAVLAQEAGRADEAHEQLERALELRPDDAPSLLRLAEIHMSQGQIRQAEPLYSQVLEQNENSAAALFGTGRIAEADGKLKIAVDAYERALEIQPAARNLHSLLASLYRRLEDSAGAERHLAGFGGGTITFEDPVFEAMQSRREGVGPLLAEALDAFAKDDFELAIERYLAALELDPGNPTATTGAAGALRKTGQMQRAADLLGRLVDADPQNRLALLELATTQIETGELEASIAGFRSLIESEPEFDKAHFGLGIALGRSERWGEAAASFRETLALSPKDQSARFHLALALGHQGSDDAALATLERTVKEAPSFLRARQHLADLLYTKGRLEEAAGHFEAVMSLEEAPAQEKALASYQLGRIASATGDNRGAIRAFEQAITLFPELWQAHIGLGHRYTQASRFREAAASFARAAAINPEHIAARLGEADSLIAAAAYSTARERLEQGLGALPRSAELANALARLLASAPDAAVRDGAKALEIANSLDRALPIPAHSESVAMALAELGRFEEAVARQQGLIREAEKEGRTGDIKRLESQLRIYRQQRPMRLGPA